jgi:hypothetical protein
MMITRRLPHNTRRLEQDIVRTLLESMRDLRVEYPPCLHDPRRAEHVQNVTTVIQKAAPVGKPGTAGS